MRRSAVSILSNIAEGFERDGTGEFIQFLSVAKGSAGELRAQLYLALDTEHVSQGHFDAMSSLSVEVSHMLGGLMVYLRKTAIKGKKYHRS